MKHIVWSASALLVIGLSCSLAQPKVEAGIFAGGPTSFVVKAKVFNAAIPTTPFSNVIATVYWESSAGITLEGVSSGFGVTTQGSVGTDGIFSYQKFGSTPNVNVSWEKDSEHELFTVTIVGPGPATFQLRNPPGSANGDYYFETGMGNLTGTGDQFYAPTTELPLPVTLSDFAATAEPSGNRIRLAWKTRSEVNNYGFTVQRKAGVDTTFSDLAAGFVPGHGTTVDPQSYSFIDAAARNGTSAYRLKQQDLDGTVHISQSVHVTMGLTGVVESAPLEFQLMQNFPNPFNPSTQVRFSVDVTTLATLKVYNVLGEEVAALFDGTADAGRYYVVQFNTPGLATGVYFYRLTTGQKTDIRKMLLVK